LFIVLEGGEGAGKSTQARILYGRLCQKNYRARLLREPGNTALGEAIRTLVISPRQTLFSRWRSSLTPPQDNSQLVAKDLFLSIVPGAELLLFTAARAQMVAEQLRPFLQRGLVVVCDRYIYSTVAYQGYGAGLNLGLIRTINELVIEGLKPDLVLLLDIDPVKGIGRKVKTQDMSRFETQELDFHRRVRQGYLRQMEDDPERWVKVDASLPKAKVSQEIWKAVEQCLAKERAEL
jgi:dTMP kinase